MANTTATVDSTSDARIINNVMRHQYKVLSEKEKVDMQKIKDIGLEMHNILTAIGEECLGDSRELNQAKLKVEEAVMWGVKHITK